MIRFYFYILLISCLFGCYNHVSAQQKGDFTMSYDNGGTTNYIYFHVPPNYDSTKTYPFLFGMHGSGMPGSDMHDFLNFAIGGKGDFIICCPDINTILDDMTKVGNLINASLNYCLSSYSVDTNKFIVTGFSMGGGLAYQLGLQNTNLFKGIIGISPAISDQYFTQKMWANINNTRMATILGDKDFNYSAVNSLMTNIKSKGAPLYYLVKPGVEHADNKYLVSQEFVEDYYNCYKYVINAIPSSVQSSATQFDISIFPNPVYKNAKIQVNCNQGSKVTVTVFDLFGNSLKSLKLDDNLNQGDYSFELNIDDLKSGIYFITVSSGIHKETKVFNVCK